MGPIMVLDDLTINKIAAGEVIERPFSVVKELVENAIDAGADKITVAVREGGITSVKITDNGCGIPAEQVQAAFLRHATNKIEKIQDMNTLQSLGFRGEALASIASVSQLEMVTKTKTQDTGTRIEIYGGDTLSIKETACNDGTTITMRNLFYNTPARKKFLKSAGSEAAAISDYVAKMALSHPDISFLYENNGSRVFQTNGKGELLDVIFHVYGKEMAGGMLPIATEKDGVAVTGYIGKPELSRGNRAYEDAFINGRFVKDKLIAKAVEDAYKTFLMSGRFPAYVLHIALDPGKVDVNAHPQKLEVRFLEEDVVYSAVYGAVSTGLRQYSLIPRAAWQPGEPEKKQTPAPEQEDQPKDARPYPVNQQTGVIRMKEIEQLEEETESIPDLLFTQPPRHTEFDPLQPSAEKEVVDRALEETQTGQTEMEFAAATQRQTEEFIEDSIIIGQIFSLYWLVQKGKSLFIIDQHAAHEKILYESILENVKKQDNYTQMLVTPIHLQLSHKERLLLEEFGPFFEQLGFELVKSGEDYYLKSVPVILEEPQADFIVLDMLDMLSEAEPDEIRGDFAAQVKRIATMACKAAVKANDKLSHAEGRALVNKLLLLDNPYTCPHGRPTMIEITSGELEKMFKRVL